MKNIFGFSILVLLVGCSSLKKETIIPYVVDLSTEKSIHKEILKSRKDIVFYVEHLSDLTLKFHLISSNDKEFLSSNRKLYINDKLYTLIFDTDYWFYSKAISNKPIVSFEEQKNVYKDIFIPSIEQREKNPQSYGYPKKAIIIDNSIYWIVDKKGKLIDTNTTN
jgi:hypothetical protein